VKGSDSRDERIEEEGLGGVEKGWDERRRIAWVITGWKRPPWME